MKRVRVLVVDDSPSMRALIVVKLEADPMIEVVGQAADALAARDAIKQINPDVMTLDVEMPKMSGLDFLDKVMRLRPLPVIMVSSLTERGAAITLELHAMNRQRTHAEGISESRGDHFEVVNPLGIGLLVNTIE